MRRLLSFVIVLFLLVSLPLCALADSMVITGGTFRAATFNVDGLPGKILGITVNPDAPGESGMALISSKLAEKDCDFVGFQEDFNYHNALTGSLNSYNFGTWRGGISWLTNDTDGLCAMWKTSRITVSLEDIVPYRDSYSSGLFNTGSGADDMIVKGFRRYTVCIDDAADVDIYVTHLDADDDNTENNAGDIAAREGQWAQLTDYILSSDTHNPCIVMGDMNSLYRQDRVKELFLDPINADSRFSVSDTWVELCKGNNYQQLTGDALDKIFYINNADSPVRLQAVKYEMDTAFVHADGSHLSDHWPVLVDFQYTVSREFTKCGSFTGYDTVQWGYARQERQLTLRGIGDGCAVFAVQWDKKGRLLRAQIVTGDSTLTTEQNASSIRLFLTDKQFRPLSTPATVQ